MTRIFASLILISLAAACSQSDKPSRDIDLVVRCGVMIDGLAEGTVDVYNGTYTEEVGAANGYAEEFMRKNEETTEAQREVFRKALAAGGYRCLTGYRCRH